jgi:hypothetical protein
VALNDLDDRLPLIFKGCRYAYGLETFFGAKQPIVVVSLPLEVDTMLTLAVGSVLGCCQMAFEEVGGAPESESIWFSIHELDDTTLESHK